MIKTNKHAENYSDKYLENYPDMNTAMELAVKGKLSKGARVVRKIPHALTEDALESRDVMLASLPALLRECGWSKNDIENMKKNPDFRALDNLTIFKNSLNNPGSFIVGRVINEKCKRMGYLSIDKAEANGKEVSLVQLYNLYGRDANNTDTATDKNVQREIRFGPRYTESEWKVLSGDEIIFTESKSVGYDLNGKAEVVAFAYANYFNPDNAFEHKLLAQPGMVVLNTVSQGIRLNAETNKYEEMIDNESKSVSNSDVNVRAFKCGMLIHSLLKIFKHLKTIK